MLADSNHFVVVTLAMLAFILVTAVAGVLAKWTHHHVTRHRLIVESKRRRTEYFQAMAQRDTTQDA